MKTLIIDNYDSFTYNLFQLIASIQGTEPLVLPNDSKELHRLHPNDYDNIVLSPGPGHPDIPKDFGICRQIILESDKPILGVCLGHQGIYAAFGGIVAPAPTCMHGRTSAVFHRNDPLYESMPNPTVVMRYHSLICTGIPPAVLEITAWTKDGLVMGLRHRHRPLWGVQFHPESIASADGKQLCSNFKNLTLAYYNQHQQPLPSKQTTSHLPRPITTPPSRPKKHYHLTVKKISIYPESNIAFKTLFANHPQAVWLDSSQVIPGFSRFSYMGANNGPLSYSIRYDSNKKITTIIHKTQCKDIPISIFDYLQQELQSISIPKDEHLPFAFQGGFIGYFGYELNQETAPIFNAKRSQHPDAQFLFLDRVLIFDHLEKCCYLLTLANEIEAQSWFSDTENQLQTLQPSPQETPPPLLSKNLQGQWLQSKETYLQRIRDCQQYIALGNSYEICLTNKLQFKTKINSLTYYENLRRINPAPHAAYLKSDHLAIACSSMERFLSINTDGRIETKPIKGTSPRGATAREDANLAAALQQDEKSQSEHLMIVDLMRHDLGKVCQINSISVPYLMQIESYTTVHQLVSTIQGHLKPSIDAIDCLKQSFPGGSMTGAPKIRTMDFINQLETEARGIYSGSIGYLSLNGATDFNIVIRTAIIDAEHVSIGAGGAIVALSDPEAEFQEIVLKTQSLQAALTATLQDMS